jgi:hypothetical protein
VCDLPLSRLAVAVVVTLNLGDFAGSVKRDVQLLVADARLKKRVAVSYIQTKENPCYLDR